MDDIIVTGTSDEQHLRNLKTVLECLRQHGTRANCEKCKFMEREVEYLGHRIDSEGIYATDGKLEAITQALPPKKVQELWVIELLPEFGFTYTPSK